MPDKPYLEWTLNEIANAIANSSLTPPQQPTAEDALAEIIRPTFKMRGD